MISNLRNILLRVGNWPFVRDELGLQTTKTLHFMQDLAYNVIYSNMQTQSGPGTLRTLRVL